jgi:hypothetical protein
MKRSTIIFGVTLVALATVATGVVTGTLGNRWQRPHDLSAVAKSLDKLAATPQVGPWRLKETSHLGPEIGKYVNEQTGDTVDMVVLVGETGPLSTHSPEVCYSSREYQVVSEPESQKIESAAGPAEFLSMTLSSDGLDGSLLRVWYAWHNGTQWRAPRNARIALRAEPFLYKIQIATYLTGLEDGRQAGSRPADEKVGTAAKQAEVCRTFLVDIMPLLNGALVQSPKQ